MFWALKRVYFSMLAKEAKNWLLPLDVYISTLHANAKTDNIIAKLDAFKERMDDGDK